MQNSEKNSHFPGVKCYAYTGRWKKKEGRKKEKNWWDILWEIPFKSKIWSGVIADF